MVRSAWKSIFPAGVCLEIPAFTRSLSSSVDFDIEWKALPTQVLETIGVEISLKSDRRGEPGKWWLHPQTANKSIIFCSLRRRDANS